MTLAVKAAVGAGSLVLAFIAGRLSVRQPIPHVVTVDRVVERRVEVAAKAEARTDVAAGPVRTVWRDRVVTVAGVDRIVREVERVEGPVRTVEVVRTEAHASEVAHETTRVAVAPARPSWAVSARAGTGLSLLPAYGGGVERRVLGGLWVGVEADTTRTAWARLRWEW